MHLQYLSPSSHASSNCALFPDRQHPEFCTYHPPTEDQPELKRLDTGAHHGHQHSDSKSYLPSPAFFSPQGRPGDGQVKSDEMVTIPKADLDRLMAQVDTLARNLAEVQSSIEDMNSHEDEDPGLTNTQYKARSARRTTLDDDVRTSSTEGVHARNDLGETIHIGGNSVPALVMELEKRQGDHADGDEALGSNILPIFGLENETATYPFVSLWNQPLSNLVRIQDLAKAIPEDLECRSTVENYRDHAHVLFPAIADMPKFEMELQEFLTERARLVALQIPESGITEEKLYGKSLYWIGLLFAALACGSQSMPGKRKVQDLASQVFVCCSFECLRLTNFFSHSNLQSIQTLLTLGNVISNNMNAGVAWVLLGLTIRIAKGLGLHKRSSDNTNKEMRLLKSKVWWSVIWQDSLLSITYDRASSNSSMNSGPQYPGTIEGLQGGWGYNECMYRLCRVGLEIIRERAQSQDPHAFMRRMVELKTELDTVTNNAADYIKEIRFCRTGKERMQHWVFYMHFSYMTSELYRPSLSPPIGSTETGLTQRKSCMESLVNCVDAFMGLQDVTPFASKSWAALHRGLSSALLLCFLREPLQTERAKLLIGRFVQLLYDITGDVDASNVAAPIRRSMIALTKLMSARPKSGAARISSRGAANAPLHIQPKRADPSQNSKAQSQFTQPGNSGSHTGSSPITMPGMSTQQGASPLSEIDIPGFERFWDSPTMASMTPLINLSEDSPYAMMDAIMWGQKNSPLGI